MQVISIPLAILPVGKIINTIPGTFLGKMLQWYTSVRLRIPYSIFITLREHCIFTTTSVFLGVMLGMTT